MYKVFLTLLFSLLQLQAYGNPIGKKVPINTTNIKLEVKDDVELLQIVNSIFPQKTASTIFDQVKGSKLAVTFINDFNFSDRSSGDLNAINDDIGRTHGYRMSFVKEVGAAVGEPKYFISISYKTELYTNSNEPEAFQNDYRDVVYLNDEGYFQADVYFKEENLFKIILGKVKTQNAYYGEVGIGFHEINASDLSRGITISSASQQAWWHHRINNKAGQASIREYNYLPQKNLDQRGVMIEADLGKDQTLYQNTSFRGSIRAGATTRISSVRDASYAGVYINLNHDYDPGINSMLPGIRLTGGHSTKKYIDGSKYSQSFIEIKAKGNLLSVSLKYVEPHTDDPRYLQALPSEFGDRDSLAPAKEPTVWLTIEGKL